MNQPQLTSQSRWLFLTLIFIFTLTMLACAFFGAGERSVSTIQRLPTLTRTPLPTLTPTGAANPLAVTGAAEETMPAPAQGDAAGIPTTPSQVEPVNPPTPVPLPTEPAVAPVSSQPILNPVVVLNVRSGPGTDYPLLGKLALGQSYQISGKNPEGTWWQIIYPPNSGSLGWVSADSQYSSTSGIEAVQIAQLPPPPPPTAIPTPVAIAQAPPSLPEVAPGQPTLAPAPISGNNPAAETTATPVSPAPISGNNPAAETTATPVSMSPGWAFNGVRMYPNPYADGLLLYGSLVNNTSTAQRLRSVLGTFYDDQNQVIAGPDSGEGYSPAYVVAPGAGAPFELAVDTIENAANFDLNVAAEPSDELPRQDFEFADSEQWTDEDSYCVSGELQNNGGELQEYLVIALTLYDSQESIISFSYYEELDPEWIDDDEELDFELCADILGQGVAHHTLQAWGR